MKFSDLQFVFESDNWKEEYNAKIKEAVVRAVEGISSIEDAKSVIRWGNFNVKDSEDRNHHPEVVEIFKEYPDIKDMVLKKFDEILTDEASYVSFVKEFTGSPVFKRVIDRKRKEFAEFFFKNLSVKDGVLSFDHEQIKNHPHDHTILSVLVEEDYDAIIGYLKEVVNHIPPAKVEFSFDLAGKKSWSVEGRNAIKVSEKGFIPRLYRAAMIAYVLDEHSGETDAKDVVVKSPAYRGFSRTLQNSIKKMTTITEADLYKEEYALFLERHACPEFFRSLQDFISLLENTQHVGKDIFAWFYNLPRHGQMHDEKKKFLDTFQEVLGRSGIFDLLKTESIFDDGRRLSELAFYD